MVENEKKRNENLEPFIGNRDDWDEYFNKTDSGGYSRNFRLFRRRSD